jgi:hypothetical protein
MWSLQAARPRIAKQIVPFLAVFVSAIIWGSLCNIAAMGTLDPRTTLGREWVLGGFPVRSVIEAVHVLPVLAVSHLFLLTLLAFTTWSPRWYTILVAMHLIGTPIAVFGSQEIFAVRWALNEGGMNWEDCLPAGIAFTISYLTVFIWDRFIYGRNGGANTPAE